MVRQTLSILLALATAGVARATSELQFDINSISTTITSNADNVAFNESFTGNLRLGHDDNSFFSRILIDGARMTSFDNDVSDGDGWVLSHFSAKVNLLEGEVLGGFLFVEVERIEDGAATGETNVYEADVTAGAGDIKRQAGQGFSIDGLTVNGMFSDSTFAGVDVGAWFDGQPLFGSFLTFSFDPGDDLLGTDENSNIDIFIVVPLPAGGVMGLSALGILTITRRRSLDRAFSAVYSGY